MPQPGNSREARKTTTTTIKTRARLSPRAATSRKGVRPARTPCSTANLPEGARLGQEGEVEPPAVVSHEDQSLAGCPAEDREADHDGDQSTGQPYSPWSRPGRS